MDFGNIENALFLYMVYISYSGDFLIETDNFSLRFPPHLDPPARASREKLLSLP